MATPNKIIIGIDNETFELTGEAAESFVKERQKIIDSVEESKKTQLARENAKNSALEKLRTLANLTDEEISALLAI
jgi:hypothetical protein